MRALSVLAIALFTVACATAPSGRSQLLLVSDSQMQQMGIAAFEQMKAKDKLAGDARQQAYVRCVTDHLVRALPAEWQRLPWETQLFEDATPNAFALPGGKIGVNTGMLRVATDQHQLAAVLGHEVGHVVFRHANERVSRSALAETGVSVVGAYAGTRGSPESTRTLMGLLGAGVQVGVLLPFSREQEREADVYGQELMARAGFDPAAAVTLWRNMQALGNAGRPPQLLSTHPDPGNRVQRLAERAPELAPVYQRARAAGRDPKCG
ncbi:M48 family metallopeptidase [Rehaibacterium terrae]|jgi:predicted Zn-dependent protease|uniref:Putative Zn-dependent protease n=1 Tax=Rehaibacterium terrae TaxID=1341696 RepID=A0A7W7XZX5_9GAMM|nr:M48 family metallopeptidase [Rehaibacterium terrae]MBB5015551.1 putative Zn-dependent protease [Rehaibacterium terrae]